MTVPSSGATVQRELWGGAVTCAVPASMLDMSDMRPVPDHQEVFLDPNTYQALIFEIVEHDPTVPDAECGLHLFEDSAAGNDAAGFSVEAVTALGPQDVPHLPPGTYKCLVRGRQAVQRGRSGTGTGRAPATAVEDTDVLLAVLRLPHLGSDLVVSLSNPHVDDQSPAPAAPGPGAAPGTFADTAMHLAAGGGAYATTSPAGAATAVRAGAGAQAAADCTITAALGSLRILDWGLFGCGQSEHERH